MGTIPIGIANEVSALQQTYGIAAHSLVFLFSYLFVIGLYSLAISIAHDGSLRKTIRKSTIELLGDMGAAQMEHEIQGQVKRLVQKNKHELEDQTGISSSLTIESAKEYSEQVIMEVQGKNSLGNPNSEEKS